MSYFFGRSLNIHTILNDKHASVAFNDVTPLNMFPILDTHFLTPSWAWQLLFKHKLKAWHLWVYFSMNRIFFISLIISQFWLRKEDVMSSHFKKIKYNQHIILVFWDCTKSGYVYQFINPKVDYCLGFNARILKMLFIYLMELIVV